MGEKRPAFRPRVICVRWMPSFSSSSEASNFPANTPMEPTMACGVAQISLAPSAAMYPPLAHT